MFLKLFETILAKKSTDFTVEIGIILSDFKYGCFKAGEDTEEYGSGCHIFVGSFNSSFCFQKSVGEWHFRIPKCNDFAFSHFYRFCNIFGKPTSYTNYNMAGCSWKLSAGGVYFLSSIWQELSKGTDV